MIANNPDPTENQTTPGGATRSARRPTPINRMKRLATTVSLAGLLLGSGALVAGCQTTTASTSTTGTAITSASSTGSTTAPIARTRSSR